jgi:hypothetical protein
VQFVGIPSETLYHVVLVLTLLSGAGIFFPQVEPLLAKKWWRLREASDMELNRMAPAWFAACQAAGVDPHGYRSWIHKGPERPRLSRRGARSRCRTGPLHAPSAQS